MARGRRRFNPLAGAAGALVLPPLGDTSGPAETVRAWLPGDATHAFAYSGGIPRDELVADLPAGRAARIVRAEGGYWLYVVRPRRQIARLVLEPSEECKQALLAEDTYVVVADFDGSCLELEIPRAQTQARLAFLVADG
jgi:hypothetical protein